MSALATTIGRAALGMPAIDADIIHCGEEVPWLNTRRQRVHASDVPNILGEGGDWGSAVTVWGEKTAPPLVVAPPMSERFALAHELEPLVCRLYERKFGGKVHRWPEFTIAVSREHPWLACTPDDLVDDPDRDGIGIGNVKTWSEFATKTWQYGVPLVYQIQQQVEMLVTGCRWGVLQVQFGFNSLERFYVERNDKFIEAMLPVLADFWSCVEMRVAPPMDDSVATMRALAKLHPDDNGEAVLLPPEADGWLARLARYKDLADRVAASIRGLESQLKALLGPHTYGATPDGEWVSWKTQSRDGYTVEPTKFRVLRRCRPPKSIEVVHSAGEIPPAPAEAIDFKVAKRRSLPIAWKREMLKRHPYCHWCGAKLTLRTATFEHLAALEVGGTNKESNLALACRACNLERGSDSTLPVNGA